MFTARMIEELLNGIGQTLYMTLFSTLLAYMLGLPIGVALYVTDKNGLKPCKPVNAVLGAIVNVVRSVPFIILLITLLPFTMWLLGTTLGPRQRWFRWSSARRPSSAVWWKAPSRKFPPV